MPAVEGPLGHRLTPLETDLLTCPPHLLAACGATVRVGWLIMITERFDFPIVQTQPRRRDLSARDQYSSYPLGTGPV